MLQDVIQNFKRHYNETKFTIFSDDSAYYAEVNGEPLTVEGLHALKESIDSIFDINSEKKKIFFDGTIPEGLLFIDFKTFSTIKWKSKAKIRTLIFNSPTIKGRFKVFIPDMIFNVSNGIFRVYFIDKKDNYYYAPFFNNNDIVCMGNQKKINPSIFKTIQEYINALEDSFFLSPFTHSGTVNPNLKMTVEKYWENITKGKKEIIFKELIKL